MIFRLLLLLTHSFNYFFSPLSTFINLVKTLQSPSSYSPWIFIHFLSMDSNLVRKKTHCKVPTKNVFVVQQVEHLD